MRLLKTLFRLTRTAFIIALITCILVILLVGLLEVGLRATGYGWAFTPFAEGEVDGKKFDELSRDFVSALYDQPFDETAHEPVPQLLAVPREKTKNTYRIFLYGGSAAHGWPTSELSMGRFLKAMLQANAPDIRFEVYNFSLPAMDSNVMRLIASEATRLEPDLHLIYMGNNEFKGPFHTLMADTVEQRVRRVQWLLKLKHLRLAQYLQRNQYAFHAMGPNYFDAFGKPTEDEIYGTFEANLTAMVEDAADEGIPTVLCTLSANLRDWPPQPIQPHTAPTETWDKAAELLIANDYPAAEQEIARLQAKYPADPMGFYLLGRSYWAQQRYEDAKAQFWDALLHDDHVTVRARPRHNQIIRRTADTKGAAGKPVALAEVAEAIEDASPHGMPGREYLLDNCHLTAEGAHLAAQAQLQVIWPFLPEHITKGKAQPDSLSFEQCETRMAIDQKLVYDIWKVVYGRYESAGLQLFTKYSGLQAYVDEKAAQAKEIPNFLSYLEQGVTLSAPDFPLQWRYVTTLIEWNVPTAGEAARKFVEDFPFSIDACQLVPLAEAIVPNSASDAASNPDQS